MLKNQKKLQDRRHYILVDYNISTFRVRSLQNAMMLPQYNNINSHGIRYIRREIRKLNRGNCSPKDWKTDCKEFFYNNLINYIKL